jgi:hypothetical protein
MSKKRGSYLGGHRVLSQSPRAYMARLEREAVSIKKRQRRAQQIADQEVEARIAQRDRIEAEGAAKVAARIARREARDKAERKARQNRNRGLPDLSKPENNE